METKRTQKLKESQEVLRAFETEKAFFYWLNVIGKQKGLNDSEKGYLIVNFDMDRRKTKRG